MRRILNIVVLGTIVAGAAACGSSSSGGGSSTTPTSTPTATSTAAAAAQIKQNWETFFNKTTPPAVTASLLQNGSSLRKAEELAAKINKQAGLNQRGQVTKVTLTSPTTATVTWNLMNGSTPVLKGSQGQAVLVNGKWLVSETTFCTLVALGNNQQPPPGCPS
jgi:hypothetical protein